MVFFPYKALFVRFQDATSRNPNSPNHPPPCLGGRELCFVSALAPGCSVVLQVSELASLGLLVVLQQAASWRSGLGEYVAGLGWKYVEDVLVVLCCFVVCSIDFCSLKMSEIFHWVGKRCRTLDSRFQFILWNCIGGRPEDLWQAIFLEFILSMRVRLSLFSLPFLLNVCQPRDAPRKERLLLRSSHSCLILFAFNSKV